VPGRPVHHHQAARERQPAGASFISVTSIDRATTRSFVAMGAGACARTSSVCAMLVLVLIMAAAGAHGARTGPRHRVGGGLAAGAARRSLLSKPGPSCCTHDPNTPGSSCCPQPFP